MNSIYHKALSITFGVYCKKSNFFRGKDGIGISPARTYPSAPLLFLAENNAGVTQKRNRPIALPFVFPTIDHRKM